jgi:hypothetical protein
VTLAVTIASLSLSGSTFDHKELRELSTNDGALVRGRYDSMICDAAIGKVYGVTESKVIESRGAGVAPSRLVYFEYMGRQAPYTHVVCQIERQGLSRGERLRVREAYRKLQEIEDDREKPSQTSPATVGILAWTVLPK